MKKLLCILMMCLLVGCGETTPKSTPEPTAEPTPEPTATATPTATPKPTATPTQSPEEMLMLRSEIKAREIADESLEEIRSYLMSPHSLKILENINVVFADYNMLIMVEFSSENAYGANIESTYMAVYVNEHKYKWAMVSSMDDPIGDSEEEISDAMYKYVFDNENAYKVVIDKDEYN